MLTLSYLDKVPFSSLRNLVLTIMFQINSYGAFSESVINKDEGCFGHCAYLPTGCLSGGDRRRSGVRTGIIVR